jgi:DNA-directed RNA polymerase specialized sigma24 family protein
MSQDGGEDDVSQRLALLHPQLVHWTLREAGSPLLRFETAEDLAQGIQYEALRNSPGLTWQGKAEFEGWLYTIARRFLQARKEYWFALKRHRAGALRVTLSDQEGASPFLDTATGPITFADRRESLLLATRALSMLLDRDRCIIEWLSAGHNVGEISMKLSISLTAAERAKHRAISRLRKAYKAVVRHS